MARRPRPDTRQLDLFATKPAAAPQPAAGRVSGSTLSAIVIRQTGFLFQDQSACCLTCFPTLVSQGADRGRGYRMSAYNGSPEPVLRRCFACGVPFDCETMQEKLDRAFAAVRAASVAR